MYIYIYMYSAVARYFRMHGEKMTKSQAHSKITSRPW